MQTDTTSTTTNATETNQETNDETTGTPPTLTDYLEARCEELRRATERAAEKKRADEERERKGSVETLTDSIEKGITPGLRRAMDLSPVEWFISDSPHDEGNRWFYEYPIARFILDGDTGDTWAIAYERGGLHLHGPRDYEVRLNSEWVEGKGYIYNRSILDAIREYPAWLEREQQRAREQAEYQAEYEAQENAAAAAEFAAASEVPTLPTTAEAVAAAEGPRHYTEAAGSDPRTALLHRGAYVTVWYINYFYNEINPAMWGTVEAWDKRWLLITADNGRQELINWRHVLTVEPRERPAETKPGQPLFPAEEIARLMERAEQTEQPQPGDFDSDKVPF